MTYDIRLTAKAEGQLKAAARWWSEHRSHEQAERWYNDFLKKLESLAKNPARCPLARENRALTIEIRELAYGLGRKPTHRALFEIRADAVIVYAIRHAARAD